MTEAIVRPVHFFHFWVGDKYHPAAWQQPFSEHFAALNLARFDGDVRVDLVGDLVNRSIGRRELLAAWPEARIEVEAEEGYEQVTLTALRTWAQAADPATPVFYAHGKGSFQPCDMNTRWRRAMDSLLADYWQDRVEDLRTHDVAALHWLTAEQYPQHIDPRRPMAGGNFWWANAGYLARLPELDGTPENPPVNRYGAEGWVGRGFPKVRDLRPGWPCYT